VIRELSGRLRRERSGQRASFQREGSHQGLLVRLAKDDAADSAHVMTPALTHQQIADMIGTSRETVTRVIKDLKGAGWLGQDGKRYVVSRDAAEAVID
jgi:CRP-like cAMP-binding protein